MSSATSYITFTGSIILCLASVLIVAILAAITIGSLQATASTIIAIAQTGASAIALLGRSIVAQAQVLSDSNSGSLLISAQDTANALLNGVQSAINIILSVGGSLLNVISDGFGQISETLAELGSQIITAFLAVLGNALTVLRVGLFPFVATFEVLAASMRAFLAPIQLVLKFINSGGQISNCPF